MEENYCDSENMSWVFDSLVGFLHGPIWNVPLQTFIEEKSLIFEPTDTGDVCERPEYKAIHDEYKNLVDVMLGTFMEDIGINAEQFEQACHMSRLELEGLPLQFHRRLFRQVWAANDYDMFVKMMTYKNVELQLQALELIERRFGDTSNIFTTEDILTEARRVTEQDDILNVIRQLQISDLSDEEDSVQTSEFHPVDVASEKKILKSKLDSVEKTKTSFDSEEVAVNVLAQDEAGGDTGLSNKPVAVSAEEVVERQEYLRRQRDRLVSLKRRARVQQLPSEERTRPASARAARALLAGAPPAIPSQPGATSLRQALADRLKTEVVEANCPDARLQLNKNKHQL